MLPEYYEFLNSVKIISGKRALENIPYELKNLGAKKPMILTSKSPIKTGLVDIIINAFKELDIMVGVIYDNISPDSSVKTVNEAAEVYRKTGCDSMIAIGGGSVIDTAKGLSIVITENADDLLDFMGAEVLNKKRSVPFIVVPTTAGTGSEATLVAVIANPDKNVKMEFVSYHLLPDVAVLDPRTTVTLPAKMTASTGMDALCHAVEAYTCIQKNPLSDAYAWAAIKMIKEFLPRAVKDGSDQDARLAMANASLMAGAAFSNSMVGIVHAIGHACGGVCHVPHGDAMSILLPYGMEYNMDTVGEYYGELLLPLAGEEIYAATPQKDRALKAVESLRSLIIQLKDSCGLATRLSEAGVKKEDLDRIARTAINDGAIIVNPKEAGYEDILGILEKAF